MEKFWKKILAAEAIAMLLVACASIVERQTEYQRSVLETSESAGLETKAVSYQDAGTDLVFWYFDETYTAFLQQSAEEYFQTTGNKVSVEYQETLDDIGLLYDKTMQDDGFPDVYLISGCNLEEAYLYGLVSVNTYEGEYRKQAATKAVEAASYQGKMIGYPLCYNVCVFIYQQGYFETEPASIQQIIDYSNDNEPSENVQYLMEWDVNDPFYDFPFIANSVTLKKAGAESMEITYDEAKYNEDLAFFENMLNAFSVDKDMVSEERIVENFLAGRTLCAIIGSDALTGLSGYSYSVAELPMLNETLPTVSCGNTQMVVVNEFSEHGDMAADFARYLTLEQASMVHELTGSYSTVLSADADEAEQISYRAYENAIPAPDSMDAKEFWVTLKETFMKYF